MFPNSLNIHLRADQFIWASSGIFQFMILGNSNSNLVTWLTASEPVDGPAKTKKWASTSVIR
jgi:hypothetical protein